MQSEMKALKKGMKPITLENLRDDPELIDELHRRAHHARAEAAHELLLIVAARLKWILRDIGSIHVSGRPAEG